MVKRALVISGGTMRGAFVVGALKKIHELLGVNYFDTIFSTSVGVFEQAFFASSQVYFMENTWREYVHGKQLINLFNPLKGRAILDLDYLVDLFQSEKSMLDIEAMKNSHPKLLALLAEHKTKKLVLLDLKEGPIFDIMRATCALPIVYPSKVYINGQRYVDSWLAPNDKFRQFLAENLKEYDEVIAISSRETVDERLIGIKNIIKPGKTFLRGPLDTNKENIIKTIEQGKIDAEKFIIENGLIKNKNPLPAFGTPL